MSTRIIPVLFLCTVFTACGTTPEERGISGAGVGASAGAIVGAVTGLSVIEGAVLGALAGGVTGAMTNKEQVNLGEPVWKQGNTTADNQTVAKTSTTASKLTVVEIQKGLKDMGYDPGVADGINGQKTQRAIRQYQKDHGLLVNGQATPELMNHIKQQQS